MVESSCLQDGALFHREPFGVQCVDEGHFEMWWGPDRQSRN